MNNPLKSIPELVLIEDEDIEYLLNEEEELNEFLEGILDL